MPTLQHTLGLIYNQTPIETFPYISTKYLLNLKLYKKNNVLYLKFSLVDMLSTM